MLTNKVGAETIDPEDVVVTGGGPSSIDISKYDIGKSVTFNAGVGLGIDSVPFKPAVGSDGGFSIGLAYRNFNFGFDSNGPYFRTNALNELQFTINGFLPKTMTAGLGFLNVQVEDKTPNEPVDNQTPVVPDLSLTFSADITPSFSISDPLISGAVHLLTQLTSSFTAPGLPQFQTRLRLDWTLPSISPSDPLGAAWGTPLLKFENVQMNVGSMLGDLVQPIAEQQALLQPMQPIFDLLQKPIPAISDLSTEMGGPQIDLVFMSKVLSA